MEKMRIKVIENETSKTFEVTVPYSPDLDSVLKNKTYTAAGLMNGAYPIFFGDGRNFTDECSSFSGNISEPRTYDVVCEVIDDVIDDSTAYDKFINDFKNYSDILVRKIKSSGSKKDMMYYVKEAKEIMHISNFLLMNFTEDIQDPYDEAMIKMLNRIIFFNSQRTDEYADKNKNIGCSPHNFYNDIVSAAYKGKPLISKGDTVYEFGVGEGLHLKNLSDSCGIDGNFLGIDIDPINLIAANDNIERFNLNNVIVSFGDGIDLKRTILDYGKADSVLIMNVLHMLDKADASKMLDEAVNACNPNGKIIAVTASKEYVLAQMAINNNNVEDDRLKMLLNDEIAFENGLKGTLFSEDRLEEEFEKRGFSATFRPNSSGFHRLSNKIYNKRPILSVPSTYFVIAEAC